MKTLQILGPGCANCQRLQKNVETAIQELGSDWKIEKVEDLDTILSLGVVRTPALVREGQVLVTGQVPTVGALKELLSH